MDFRLLFRTSASSFSIDNKSRLLVRRRGRRCKATRHLSTLSVDDCEPQNIYKSFIDEGIDNYVASCDGLLFFVKRFEGEAIIWNPKTDEVKLLPHSDVKRPHDINSSIFGPSGFGFDSKSNDYKVIRFICHTFSKYDLGSVRQVELYSFRKNSWKEIVDFPPCYLCLNPCVYVNGCVYWMAMTDPYIIVCSFDFADECFSAYPLAVIHKSFVRPKHLVSFRIVEFGGSVGVLAHNYQEIERCFELWVMKENDGVGCWTKLFDVRVDGANFPLGFCKNSRFLFFEGMNGELLVYNCTTKESKKLDIYYDRRGEMQFISHVESIVSLNNGPNAAAETWNTTE